MKATRGRSRIRWGPRDAALTDVRRKTGLADYDGGPDGLASTTAGKTLCETPGVFVP